MNNLSDFNSDLKLSHETMPLWKEHFSKYFGSKLIEIIDHKDDNVKQRNGIDLTLILSDDSKLNSEIKIRSKRYIDYAGVDMTIEKTGNTTTGSIGSGIMNNNSDIFCYGWYDGMPLIHPKIYSTPKLKHWIMKNSNRLKIKSTNGTKCYNGSYQTDNYIIKCSQVEHLLHKLEDIDIRVFF